MTRCPACDAKPLPSMGGRERAYLALAEAITSATAYRDALAQDDAERAQAVRVVRLLADARREL